MKRSLLAIVAVAFFAAISSGAAIGAEPIKWQVQTSEVAGTAKYKCSEHFAELVNEKTNGRLQIELFSADTLYPTLNVIEIVTYNMNPAALTSGDYHSGKEIMLKVETSRPSDPWHKRFDLDQEFYERIEPLTRKAYENSGVYFVGSVQAMPGEAFHSTVPINTLSDFKGLRVRTAGLGQELYESFGAAVTLMPMGDVYTAMKLGTVQACEVGGFVDNYALALFEVAKFNIEPALHAPAGFNAGHLIVNKDAWAAVPDDIKTILHECAMENRDWSWHFLNSQNDEYQKLFEDAGTKTIYLSDADIAQAGDNAAQNLKNYWGRSKLLDEFLAIYVDFLEEKGFQEVADKIRK
jgi:TRAP-type C4-dicarboxylate transport system substrate-binding protein